MRTNRRRKARPKATTTRKKTKKKKGNSNNSKKKFALTPAPNPPVQKTVELPPDLRKRIYDELVKYAHHSPC